MGEGERDNFRPVALYSQKLLSTAKDGFKRWFSPVESNMLCIPRGNDINAKVSNWEDRIIVESILLCFPQILIKQKTAYNNVHNSGDFSSQTWNG